MFKSKQRAIVITQHEHGRLAGMLAANWGNARFAKPSINFDSFVKGVTFHDRGYGPGSIGGVRGSGFRPKGYDFYDGNRHGGHPAHDIFVQDADQDALDDATGRASTCSPCTWP